MDRWFGEDSFAVTFPELLPIAIDKDAWECSQGR